MFDKLLILRALRPEFPEALFFTTDFDEAFTIKSELPFTRNLLISSSFGPNLSEWLQGDIPFFRDTYQASAFLATQLAVGHLAKNLETPNHFGTDLSSQLLVPRLFEVKRNGEILQFAWGPQPSSSKRFTAQNTRAIRHNTRTIRWSPKPPPWQKDVRHRDA